MWTPPSRASKLSVQDGSSDQVQSYVRLLDAIMTCVLDREPVWFTCISSISFARAQRHSAFYWFCRWHLADSFPLPCPPCCSLMIGGFRMRPRSRCPILVMAPVRCRTPMLCSRGVIPIQAANSRPFLKCDMSEA